MSRFAAETKVPVDRSRAAIEKVLSKYGATGFASGWEFRVEQTEGAISGLFKREHVTLVFEVKKRKIRLDVPMPVEHEVGSKKRVEQAVRQRWRAMLLVITAKLEAVESGLSTIESEFLAGVVTPTGETVGQRLLPRLSDITSGKVPLLGDGR